jgi:hypothetical protein
VQATDAVPDDLSVASGDNGAVYVGGHFRGIATLGTTPLVAGNNAEAFVGRLDSAGALRWVRTVAGPGAESVQRLVADPRGDVYVLFQGRGETPGTPIDVSGKPVNSMSDSVVVVAKYSGERGNLQWAQPCRGMAAGTLLAALGTAGGVVVGGTSDEGAALLQAFNPGGGPLWSQSPHSTGLLEITAMATTPEGGVVVAGAAAGTSQFGSLTLNDEGGFLAGLKADGSFAWAQKVAPGTARLEQLFVSPGGEYTLVGTFDGRYPDAQTLVLGSLQMPNAGGRDVFVAGLNVARVPVWALRAGGPGDDAAGRGSMDALGRLQLPLVFDGAASIGDLPVPGPGLHSHLARVAPGGGIDWVFHHTAGSFSAVAADGEDHVFTAGTWNGDATVDGFPITAPASNAGSLLTRIGIDPIPAFIVVGPAPRTVPEGSPVTLATTAGGTPPFTFQWRHNGIPLADKATPTLSLVEAAVGDSGQYDVIVCDAHDCAQSAPALLTVVPMPALPATDWVRIPWGPATGGIPLSPPPLVDMGTDAGGNLYLIGSMPAAGAVEGYPLGTAEGFFIVSYTPSGTLRWFTQDSVGASCGPVRLAVNPAGECFVDGWSLAQAGDTESAAFLNKYSPTGARAWSRTDPAATRLGIAAGTQGGCSVLTLQGAAIRLESFTGTGTPSRSTDLSGIPMDNPGAYSAIGTDPAGGTYAAFTFTGSFQRWGDHFQPAGAGDVLLTRFDAEGTPSWRRTLRSAGRVRVFALAASPTGRLSVCGAVYGGRGADLGGGPVYPSRAFAPFVAQYLGDGSLAWAQFLDGELDFLSTYARVATDDAGRLYVSARSAKPFVLGPYPLDPSVGGNLFVARYSASGSLDWVRQAETEGVQLMSADPAGGVCAAGAVSQPFLLGGEWIRPDAQGVVQTLWIAHWVPRSRISLLPGDPAAALVVAADYPGVYAVERSSDLRSWQPVGLGTNHATGSFQVLDTSPPDAPLRAYRARLLR